ncbi:hypothetical protein QBC46DRAFT_94522 [Diplogelasinospora grovesii]|uniref:PLL-like beta propeller domain-containing protein n=1 Tax=Diplogelasinospora grovesii TaxID=303347 RepID=A0AAN6S9N0_9PEZI|nr:hypothetical protein QBC46DRAFT_94522 [Diplogelasinospora grovesii]
MSTVPDLNNEPEFGPPSDKPEAQPDVAPDTKPRWYSRFRLPPRSRRVWFTAGVIVGIIIVVIAVVVGVVVGVVGKKSHDTFTPSSTSSITPTGGTSAPTSTFSPTSNSPSVCRGTICPSMLAVVPDSSLSAPPSSRFFFALGSDQAIWYRRGDGDTWFDSAWISLGGTFQSQPAAVTYTNNQTKVFALDNGSSMQVKSLNPGNGTFSGTVWDNLGGTFTSSVSACSWTSGVIDILGRGADGALWQGHYTESDSSYQVWNSLGGGSLSSDPVAICTPNDHIDVLTYVCSSSGGGGPCPLHIRRYNGTAWMQWESVGGDFRGDPTAVVRSQRTDYFGIGADLAMWHVSLTGAAGGYSQIESLGGSFESVPYAVAVGGNRLDVFGISSTNDHLLHRAYIDNKWVGSGWEDLGGSWNSAPVAITTPSGKLSVFGVADTGRLFHGSWKVDGTVSTANLTTQAGGQAGGGVWSDDGGGLGTKWFRTCTSGN